MDEWGTADPCLQIITELTCTDISVWHIWTLDLYYYAESENVKLIYHLVNIPVAPHHVCAFR